MSTASKEFYELVRVYGGISLEYSALTESDFSGSAGAAYAPPERGNYRRIAGARQIQLLSDSTGVIETFQTTSAEVFLPANTLSDSTNDAGNGRLYFFKNSGTSSITIKDYLGTSLWVVRQFGIVIIVGNDNNNWDFYFTAKNIFYDNAISGLTSENVKDAIDELNLTGGVSASPGFTWGASGTNVAGSYLQNETVPSNVAGRVCPVNNGYIREIFVANEVTTTFKVEIQKRTGPGTFSTLTSATITSARSGVFAVNVAVAKGDELAVRIAPDTANNPRNTCVGIIIKGTTS